MGKNLNRPVQIQEVSEPAHNVDELGKLDQVDRPSSSHHVDKRNCDLNYADCLLATNRSMQLLSQLSGCMCMRLCDNCGHMHKKGQPNHSMLVGGPHNPLSWSNCTLSWLRMQPEHQENSQCNHYIVADLVIMVTILSDTDNDPMLLCFCRKAHT